MARKFKPIRIAVLTISDSRGRAEDTSGDLLAEYVANAGHQLGHRRIVKDDVDVIAQKLRQWIADPQIDCVISTGGTGLTGRDVAPEAFARVWDKEIPGFGELFLCRRVKKLKLRKGGSFPTFLVLDGRCTTSLPWTLE